MKSEKRVLKMVVIVAFMLVVIMPKVGYAAKSTSSEPTIGQAAKSKTAEMVPNSDVSIQSTIYIKSYNLQMNQLTSDQFQLIAYTNTYSIVNEVGVILTLQKWNASSGRWEDKVYIGKFSNTSSNLVEVDTKYTVTEPGYYRLTGEHYASDGTYEYINSVSEYIQLG